MPAPDPEPEPSASGAFACGTRQHPIIASTNARNTIARGGLAIERSERAACRFFILLLTGFNAHNFFGPMNGARIRSQTRPAAICARESIGSNSSTRNRESSRRAQTTRPKIRVVKVVPILDELVMRVRTTEPIEQPSSGVDWKMVDTALRTIAQRRGALDALEAKWIREALRVKIWREVGCVTMAEYLERRLGYAPRTAYDRVRVAMALEELPKLAAALEAGLPHSAVRALTRVCTNANEQKWLDGARGKSVHEIENMVAGRARGSDPEDPPNPNLVGRTLPFEGVRPATEALVRDARRALQEERANGEVMSDDDVLAAFARCVLERGTGERSIAPYQVAVGLCERCGCGWQESGGRKFALSKADTERACCDAQWIGRVDGGAPERATQDVTPSVRRMVHRRARGRCEIPGCRSTRCLEIHHIVPRSLGGSHDPENLILTCDGCHAAHHRGLIAIRGTASELIVGRKHELAYDMVANDEC